MIKLVRRGYAVDCLEMGVFRIATSGTTKSSTGTLPLTIKFTPSKKMREAVSEVQISEVAVSKTVTLIDSIVDVTTGTSEGKLTSGGSVEIRGSGLKVVGQDSGVWLAAVDGDGKHETDQTAWKSVQRIHHNGPKRLEVVLPGSLAAGDRYVLVIKTSSSNSGVETNTSREYVSEILTVN